MKYIKGYEGFYSVTKCGKVFTHRRGKFMSPGMGGGGRYRMVTLTRDGKPKGFLVHRLVALTYLDNPDGKPEVNHIDGDRENNALSNLEWVTPSENMRHAIDIGLVSPQGHEETHFKKGFDPRRKCKRKLSDDQVREIRGKRKDGMSYNAIAKIYDINPSNIRRCCTGESYGNVV